jgi:hypothetical protein
MTIERERHDDMTVTPLFGADGAVHSSAPHMTAHRFRSVGRSLAGDAASSAARQSSAMLIGSSVRRRVMHEARSTIL